MPPDVRFVGEAEIRDCYPLMHQLRPDLASPDAFVEGWRRMQAERGYQILSIWSANGPVALAGFREQESFIHGRFIYVDDLVANADDRGQGHGGRLLDLILEEGQSRGCSKLVLDTGLDNVLAHRFYYRQGLLARALRFSIPLD